MTDNKTVTLWLGLICVMVLAMISIGGYTRLTDSGLSITQWKPITGVWPPLSDEAWFAEFGKYQQSPEYQKINSDITLGEFKKIFWVEFVHRLWGRVLGICYIVPLLFFVITKKISRMAMGVHFVGLLLLGAQGFAGWYMVKSGLVDNPYVSHFRLALHLLLAVIFYSLIFWQFLAASVRGTDGWFTGFDLEKTKALLFANLAIICLIIQIIFGAFVAGLDAGLIYNQYPLMGESIVPHEFANFSLSTDLLSDHVFVQFFHRHFAIVVIAVILGLYFALIGKTGKKLQISLHFMLFILFLQFALGVVTLLYSVPLFPALIHQLGAVLLLSLVILVRFLLNHSEL